MRKAILPIAGILLLGAGVAIGWFAARRGMLASEQKAVSGGLDGPMLETVDEAEEALRLAGFDRAFVFRWRGALLDGHILLDTPQGTKRISLNTEGVTRNALAVLASELTEKGGDPQLPKRQPQEPNSRDKAHIDLARVRGLIVIAIRPKASGTAGQECIMSFGVTVGKEDKSAGASTGLISGRLPDFTSTGRGNRYCKLKLTGGGERDLFELRLRSDIPSTTR